MKLIYFPFPDWAKQTKIADEHVIPTLARVNIDTLSQGRGNWIVTQDLEPVPKYRFARWYGDGRCEGVWRHEVCVFSLADLSTIVKARSALINKVMTKHDSAIGECLRDSVRMREIMENV